MKTFIPNRVSNLWKIRFEVYSDVRISADLPRGPIAATNGVVTLVMVHRDELQQPPRLTFRIGQDSQRTVGLLVVRYLHNHVDQSA